jgi:hypothetical protein
MTACEGSGVAATVQIGSSANTSAAAGPEGGRVVIRSRYPDVVIPGSPSRSSCSTSWTWLTTAVGEAPIVAGGSPAPEWLRLTFDQMMDHDLAFEVPGGGSYGEWRRLTDDPDQWFTGVPIVAACGQRPGS